MEFENIKDIKITSDSAFIDTADKGECEVTIVDYINDRDIDTPESEVAFQRLKQSIEKTGELINPLIFARIENKNDRIEILCGRRRLRALRQIAKKSENAGGVYVNCRILTADASREERNIIAFDDNQNRKDLSEGVKYYPLFLLAVATFYKQPNYEQNPIALAENDEFFKYMKAIVDKQPKNDDTSKLIENLAARIGLSKEELAEKFSYLSVLSNKTYRLQLEAKMQLKKLNALAKSSIKEVRELFDEVLEINTIFSESYEDGYADESIEEKQQRLASNQACLDKINAFVVPRLGLELKNENLIKSGLSAKQIIKDIIDKYIRKMESIEAKGKPTKQQDAAKKVRSALKGLNDEQLNRVLDFIKGLESKDVTTG